MLTFIKEKNYKFDYIKFWKFCSIKDIKNELNAKDRKWDKIFATYLEYGLTYKEICK